MKQYDQHLRKYTEKVQKTFPSGKHIYNIDI